ncbi:transcriptional corepressor LEUNIG-like isoform X2 [Phaseolus vulgaris]
MSHSNWEADKMLDLYIHDYLMKRQLHASARVFQAEGNVSTGPVVIEAPSGFLLEWWSVFWDIYIARANQKHTEAAASYSKNQQTKARLIQQEQEFQNINQNQQTQMQLLLQRRAQQQRLGGTQLISGSARCPIINDPLIRQYRAAPNSMATRLYEDRLKLPCQRDASEDANVKKIADDVGRLLNPNHAVLLKAAGTSGEMASGQPLFSAPPCILPGNIQHVQNLNQKLLGSTQDMKSEMNALLGSQAVVSEGSFIGCHGSNPGGSNLTLKGWPLAGLDELRSGLLQPNNLMHCPQSFNQLSLRQQLMLLAEQNLISPPVSDIESRRLGMFFNDRNMSLVKDGQSNSVDDLVLSNGSPAQVGSPMLPHPDSDVFFKQLQQYSQHLLPSQPCENLQQQEKIGCGLGSMTIEGNVSNSLQGNDQAPKTKLVRKRKSASSSGPGISSGTANTTGPPASSPASSPDSSPSTPSTQTPGEMITVSTLQQNAPSSKSAFVFGTDGLGSLTSSQNQLADMDHLVGDGCLGDNIDSFISPDDSDIREKVGKGFIFKEIKHIMAGSHKVECCHFSSDGKLLATGGHDNKVSLWCTELFNQTSTLEEHSEWITDVRFCPSMLRVATSSADKTVRVWDIDNPSYSIRTFTGHATTVTSLDFHPSKDDLICSCDSSEIRYWSIKNGSCTGVFKGGATQMRFQPCLGKLLAAAVDNFVSIFDVETLGCRLKLQGHNNVVRSVCWDSSGKCLASLSDDLVRIWTVGSGSKGECIHEFAASGNKFNTCVFHSVYPLLVIGCNKTIELWDFGQNKTLTLHAHEKAVSSLAVSNVTGFLASTSHDKHFKIWK